MKRTDARSNVSLVLIVLCYNVLLGLLVVAPMMVDDGNGPVSFASPVKLKIALVKPVFTATAYSSFYQFYAKYLGTPVGQNVTSDLGLLNATLVDSWGFSVGLQQSLVSKMANEYGIIMGRNVALLNDVNITQGGLFNADGSNTFDVVVLGFTEYVTVQQYHSYGHFVRQGGRLILMDATNFLVEVRYHSGSHHVSLARGHGWGFDGKRAWRDIFDRWRDENAKWVGSTFCCSHLALAGAALVGNHPISLALKQKFGSRVFTSYHGHEENQVTNMTNTLILAQWTQPSNSAFVAAYLHRYVAGSVVHIGVMGSDVVANDVSVQFFLIASILDSSNS